MKVTDYIVERLSQLGVHTVFGYQGGNITHFIDSVYKKDGMIFVENYHEQAAAFSANAYAITNNTIGVAVSTSGPGAINLLAGIANAFFDSVPCLFFTGDVNTTSKKPNSKARQNAFQETDIVSIALPITKYCTTVMVPEDIVVVLEKAICAATTGRKGPVLINLPHDIQRAVINVLDFECEKKEKLHNYADEFMQIKEVLNHSKNPVIIVGGGMKSLKAKALLVELLKKTPMPVVSSLRGLDVLPHNHDCYCGMIGDYGNRSANLCLNYSDCIFVLGSRLDDRQIGPADAKRLVGKKVIHVDIDPNELKSKVEESLSIEGEVEEFLEVLISSIDDFHSFKKWVDIVKIWKQRYPSYLIDSKKVDANTFIYGLSKSLQYKKSIFTLDVGLNQMNAAQSLYINELSSIHSSAGLGAMGFSLPAAIGASFVDKSHTVYCISGDGGLQMNLQELNTVDFYKLPINIVLLNNHSLGMIRDYQSKVFDGRYYATVEGYSTPNFKKIALAFGFEYFCVKSIDDYEHAYEILQKRLRVFVEVNVPTENTTIPQLGQGLFQQKPFLSQDEIDRIQGEADYEKN